MCQRYSNLLLFQPNTFTVNKLYCTKPVDSSLTEVICNYKPVSNIHFNVTMILNATRPLDHILAHAVLFHSYNDITYQKFLIDVWQDLCDVLTWMENRLSPLIFYSLMYFEILSFADVLFNLLFTFAWSILILMTWNSPHFYLQGNIIWKWSFLKKSRKRHY